METPTAPSRRATPLSAAAPQELSRVKTDKSPRITLSMTEVNRVLGGGLVRGALVLVGGDPGIGKSTLLLQVSAALAASGQKVAYVSGEESVHQLKLRADRLAVDGERLFLLPETSLSSILGRLDELSPSMVVIDSIQTMYQDELTGTAGSVGQIRECTSALMRWAKQTNVPVVICGHVTKDGAIAGPKALEHIVDVVLYLEGDQFGVYRVLRSVKNRFGSSNELGVFEMTSEGLREVTNPSEAFLSEHQGPVVGSAVVPTLEGTRPLLIEIQALTSQSTFVPPRRTVNGLDFNRLLLITAVLGKRAGLRLANQDIMVNVVGGLKVNEPAADLAVALSIASSYRDAPVLPKLAAVGEISLSGELRGVPQLERRVAEAARLGFEKCLVPRQAGARNFASLKCEIIKAGTVAEALRAGLMPSKVREAPDDDPLG
jgi:DNA repair protein RadA/Sms